MRKKALAACLVFFMVFSFKGVVFAGVLYGEDYRYEIRSYLADARESIAVAMHFIILNHRTQNSQEWPLHKRFVEAVLAGDEAAADE
ncbi:MAG: hypothetical protein A2Z72_01865 [Omnitrophica bacterium RBG_13_46_9]|nr:MAG: hypothetical protein A2Z72_01865 [Omnitrophica bacterium RBG_13_46_9]